MKKTRTSATLTTVCLLLLLISCGKKSTDTPTPTNPNEKEFVQTQATSIPDKWVYFSFETGKTVEGITEGTYKGRTDWDIAFSSFYFRTNSGKSGSGKGGALMTDKEKLSDVTTAPESGYTVDEDMIARGYRKGPTQHNTTANIALSGEYKETPSGFTVGQAIKFQGPPPSYRVNDKIFVIRTAQGKYAKVKFISFANSEGKMGFVTFRYVYQNNGTTKFD